MTLAMLIIWICLLLLIGYGLLRSPKKRRRPISESNKNRLRSYLKDANSDGSLS